MHPCMPTCACRSIQDELGRETGAEIGTVAASYAAMLAYIAVSLGGMPSRMTRPLLRKVARVCVLRWGARLLGFAGCWLLAAGGHWLRV